MFLLSFWFQNKWLFFYTSLFYNAINSNYSFSINSDSIKHILWSFCDCTAQSYFDHMYHQSTYYQSTWCLRLCAHPNLPHAGVLRSKIFSGYDIPSANESYTKTDLQSHLIRLWGLQPAFPTCSWSSGITIKTDEVHEGCYDSPSSGQVYTRLSENAKAVRAGQTRNPPCPISTRWAPANILGPQSSLSSSAPQTSSTTPYTQGEQAPASLPLNQTTGIASCSIPSIFFPVPHHIFAQGERARNPSKPPCSQSWFYCTLGM